MSKATMMTLPHEVLALASLRGKEYAWRFDDLPAVIEAARHAGLLNIGGQLQFRFPDAICECYWVEVDTYTAVSTELPWSTRVTKAADIALSHVAHLASTYDFIKEGRQNFPTQIAAAEARGENPADAMCFVWYVVNAEEDAQLGASTT